MHFASRTEINTPLAKQIQCYEFAMEQFPKAFMAAQVTEEGDDEPTRVDKYVTLKEQIQSATWNTPAEAKAFEKYVDTMLGFVKRQHKGSSAQKIIESIDAPAFLAYLTTSFDSQICSLEMKAASECNLQRFMLMLMPFIAAVAENDYETSSATLTRIYAILRKIEGNEISSQVNYLLQIYLQLYNNFNGSNGLKAQAFVALMNLCQRIDRLDIMIQKCRSIEKDSANWNLTVEDRRSLYQAVASTLDQINDGAAFNLTQAYVKLFNKSQMNKDVEAVARRCVILALKSSDIINFEELLENESIKSLSGADAELVELLSAFTTTDAKDFKNQLSKYSSLLKKESITEEQMILKKSYLQICQLSTEQTTNFKYKEVASLLNMSEDDVEEWAIEAIANRIIDAKIDQINEELIINSHMLCKVGKEEWKTIGVKVSSWKQRFQRMYDVLAASQQMEQKAM